MQIEKGSLASRIFSTEALSGCPSWHHQAVLSVANTNLTVSGSTDTNGERMVEIIEYQGKGFIIGFRFHPEAATVKHIKGAENASKFMSLEVSLKVFQALLDHIK